MLIKNDNFDTFDTFVDNLMQLRNQADCNDSETQRRMNIKDSHNMSMLLNCIVLSENIVLLFDSCIKNHSLSRLVILLQFHQDQEYYYCDIKLDSSKSAFMLAVDCKYDKLFELLLKILDSRNDDYNVVFQKLIDDNPNKTNIHLITHCICNNSNQH